MHLSTRLLLDIVLFAFRLSVELREGQCCLACIADLATIPPGVFMLPPVLACCGNDLIFFDLYSVLETTLDKAEIESEYLGRRYLVKRGIV